MHCDPTPVAPSQWARARLSLLIVETQRANEVTKAGRFMRLMLRMTELSAESASVTWEANKRGFNSRLAWLRSTENTSAPHARPNPLREFFNNRKEGSGIWKWNHYFDIYDRHFCKFRGQEVHVLEIGVYSGGSLEMWRDYFGSKAHIYGVDIEPACRAYETDSVEIVIGDQGDRQFWREFRRKVPVLDIVIDDGGHQPEQQIVSVEELLPFLRPGGVYLCEDVTGEFNQFASYIHGLGHRLNDYSLYREFPDDNSRRLVCGSTPFQCSVGSIHLYPFVTVLERNPFEVAELVAPKHGTEWQPYLK
jgi:hypothetical protein